MVLCPICKAKASFTKSGRLVCTNNNCGSNGGTESQNQPKSMDKINKEPDLPYNKGKKWDKLEDAFLILHYPFKGQLWCAEELNRTKQSIRDRTAFLKLKLSNKSDFFKEFQKRAAKSKVGKKRPEHSVFMKELAINGNHPLCYERTEEERKKISERTKKYIQVNGHPKGFLGKHHSEEAKKRVGTASKKMWENPNNYCNSEEYRQKLSDRVSKQAQLRKPQNCYSRCKIGTYDINGVSYFFRSRWEANYALYLDFLIKSKKIKKWEYEKETFIFEKIKRGTRSYKPDFKITNTNDSIEYHEIKGWLDSKSKTRLKRMELYYPQIKLILIGNKEYKELLKKMGGILKFYK